MFGVEEKSIQIVKFGVPMIVMVFWDLTLCGLLSTS